MAVAATGVTAACVAALAGRSDGSWDRWRAATCMPDHCFCERIRSGAVRQPANAFSSLAFVLIACRVLLQPALDRRARARLAPNRMTSSAAYPAAYALALLLIGLGSAFYHASLTFVGQFVDVLGMYLVATFVLMYNWGRLSGIRPSTAVRGYVALTAGLALMLVWAPRVRRVLFATLLLAALRLEYIIRRRARPSASSGLLWTALGLVSAGFAIWVLDLTRLACDPSGWLQGHAVWHVLGAVASWLVFRYYHSERPAGA